MHDFNTRVPEHDFTRAPPDHELISSFPDCDFNWPFLGGRRQGGTSQPPSVHLALSYSSEEDEEDFGDDNNYYQRGRMNREYHQEGGNLAVYGRGLKQWINQLFSMDVEEVVEELVVSQA